MGGEIYQKMIYLFIVSSRLLMQKIYDNNKWDLYN